MPRAKVARWIRVNGRVRLVKNSAGNKVLEVQRVVPKKKRKSAAKKRKPAAKKNKAAKKRKPATKKRKTATKKRKR